MTDSKARRQRAIEELLRTSKLTSQEELAGRLSQMGFAVGQATVSRDLDELGAVRLRVGGVTRYSMPDQIAGSGWAQRRLEEIFRDWVRTVDIAGTIVIIKTPPGSAHMVGAAVDQAEMAEVAGTICGDDTIFAAANSAAAAEAVAKRLRRLLTR